MSNTSEHKILVPVDALHTLLSACVGKGPELREIIATRNLPDLTSLEGHSNPLKTLIDIYQAFVKNEFANATPTAVYFYMEENENIHLSSCHTENKDVINWYEKQLKETSPIIKPGGKIVKASVVFEEVFCELKVPEETKEEPVEISPLTIDEKYQVILKLASESTFYQTDGRTFRIDSWEIEGSEFFISDENTGYTQNVHVESVKDTDVFMKTFNVSVKDFLASHISETNT